VSLGATCKNHTRERRYTNILGPATARLYLYTSPHKQTHHRTQRVRTHHPDLPTKTEKHQHICSLTWSKDIEQKRVTRPRHTDDAAHNGRMKDDATVNGDVGAVRLCAKKSVVSARSLVTKKEDGLEKPGLVEVSQTIKSLDELCPRRTKATKKEWISRYTSLGRVIRRNGSVEIQGLERDQSKYKSWKGSDEKTGLGRAKA